MSSLEIFLRVLGYLLVIWVPGKRCELKQFLFRIEFCQHGNQVKDVDLNFDPNDWLKSHPEIAAQVEWLRSGNVQQPWSSWTRAQRRDLRHAYFLSRIDALHGIEDRPPDAAPASVGISSGTFYPATLAWRIYVAHVATVIAAEHGRWVNWRVQDLPEPQRQILFHAQHYFELGPQNGRYVSNHSLNGTVTLSDPTKVWRELRGLGWARPTRRESIATAVQWAKDNMLHYGQTPGLPNDTGDVNEQHWQYRGNAPQILVLTGTTHISGEFAHWTAGCSGTAAFFKATLRLMGIPVEVLRPTDHASVGFPGEGWFLGHGDDPYNRLFRCQPPLPIERLFMSTAEYQATLGPQVPAQERLLNIDRHAYSLAVETPSSDYVLFRHCRDLAASRSHAQSEVYQIFRNYFSLADLESGGMWQRIDTHLAARGGCANIPNG